ncbi:hypothetical protein Tco_0966339 [Tanacetum coccineum]
MRLAKKVRGIVEASESFRGKLVKTMGEEASYCRASCIYRGKEDQSFSILSSSKFKMAYSRPTSGAKRRFVTSSLYRRVNRESKRLDGVLVAEFKDGKQFVTEEIIKGWNR